MFALCSSAGFSRKSRDACSLSGASKLAREHPLTSQLLIPKLQRGSKIPRKSCQNKIRNRFLAMRGPQRIERNGRSPYRSSLSLRSLPLRVTPFTGEGLEVSIAQNPVLRGVRGGISMRRRANAFCPGEARAVCGDSPQQLQQESKSSHKEA